MWTPAEMEDVLRNLDRRLGRVEQILPTLPTREEMHAAIQAAVAPLATREEMQAAIRAAVAPLATKEELRAAIAPLATKAELHEGLERVFERTKVLIESLRDDIRLLAENQVMLGERLARLESR